MRAVGAVLLLLSAVLSAWAVSALFGPPWAVLLVAALCALAGAGLVVEVPPRR